MCEVFVIYYNDVVIGLIGYLVGVISGGVLYCKLSFLFDYLGK